MLLRLGAEGVSLLGTVGDGETTGPLFSLGGAAALNGVGGAFGLTGGELDGWLGGGIVGSDGGDGGESVGVAGGDSDGGFSGCGEEDDDGGGGD